jgi:hypothetical protein
VCWCSKLVRDKFFINLHVNFRQNVSGLTYIVCCVLYLNRIIFHVCEDTGEIIENRLKVTFISTEICSDASDSCLADATLRTVTSLGRPSIYR